MMASCYVVLFILGDNVDSRLKVLSPSRPVIIVVGSHAGNFAGMAANTAGDIGNNKFIHLLPFIIDLIKGLDAIIRHTLCLIVI